MVCKGIIFIYYFETRIPIILINTPGRYTSRMIPPCGQVIKCFVITTTSYLFNVSYQQVPSRCFPAKIFCKLTSERKTGTPVFQKTAAKKIKKM
jgi:hypothetical protein